MNKPTGLQTRNFMLEGPALVDPNQSTTIETSLRQLASLSYGDAVGQLPLVASSDDDFWPENPDSWAGMLKPYTVVNGVLQIPIRGMLLHDFPYQLFGWATGYKYIEKAFQRGLGDGNVRGIAMIFDSPGGMVAGCFDAVDRMTAMREESDKPVRAFSAESATSAAYALATVADEIIMSRTAVVGSVGVVTSHADWSKFYADFGVKITFIHAGKHKVDGNHTEPLSDDAKARIQARIDEMYDVFVASVAKNRGLEEQAVRDTEALVYSASEAQSVGFADGIGALDESLADWSASLNPELGDFQMKTNDQAADNAAELETARAEGVTEGHAAGVTAERNRFKAILALPEAKDRQASALAMALETDMTAEQAAAVLKTLPEATATAPAPAADGTAFNKAMDESGNPDIEATNDEPTAELPAAKRILADAGILKPTK